MRVFKKILKILKRAFRRKRRPLRKHSRKAAPRKIPRRRRPAKALKKTKRKARIPRARSAKKSIHKKQPKKPPKSKKPQFVGEVTHYFPKVNAAVVKLKRSLSLGEPVWIKGKSTDFRQTIGSMQIDRKPIEKAKKGEEIGLEVFKEVRPGDHLYISE